MNEDMDKKVNRSSCAPSPTDRNRDRGDYKRNQYGKRRERHDSKPKTSRPPAQSPALHPSKNDGRTYSRGMGNRMASQKMRDDENEIGSLYRPGSKKQNMNHLLNFSFSPRQSNHNRGGGYAKHRPTRSNGSYHKSKTEFLQANCQFVVCDGKDYSLQLTDPDVIVDWDHIEQVRLLSHEVPSCPICLYPPTAAKITKCGHIYCWPCILHYIYLSEKKQATCPICEQHVSKKDLKSVVSVERRNYHVKDDITLTLMYRNIGSSLAYPYSEQQVKVQNEEALINVDADNNIQFSRLLVATPDQVTRIHQQDKQDLLALLLNSEDDLEKTYIDLALKSLEEDELALEVSRKFSLEQVSPDEDVKRQHQTTPGAPPRVPVLSAQKIYKSAFNDEEEEEATSTSSSSRTVSTSSAEEVELLSLAAGVAEEQRSKDREQRPSTGSSTSEEQGAMALAGDDDSSAASSKRTAAARDRVFFYQASDGQHIYLHSLNFRSLLHEYKNWENCPTSLTANILQMDEEHITMDLRQRLRFLGHLPVNCPYNIVELELKEPVLSKETLTAFKRDLDKRHRGRQNKEKQERRRQKQNSRSTKEGAGLSVSLASTQHFPSYSAGAASLSQQDANTSYRMDHAPIDQCEGDVYAVTAAGAPSPSLDSSTLSVSPPADSLGSPPTDDNTWLRSGPSFAQMMHNAHLLGSSGFDQAPRSRTISSSSGGTGAAAAAHRRPMGAAAGSDGEEDDSILAPQYQASFCNDIQQAIEASLALQQHEGATAASSSSAGACTPHRDASAHANSGSSARDSRKKKKKTKTILFSTGIKRS